MQNFNSKKKLNFIIIALILSSSLLASVYEKDELISLKTSVYNQSQIDQFVLNYANSQYPITTEDIKKIGNSWLEEAELYEVLNFIASQPKSYKNERTLNTLNNFKSISKTYHDEGQLEIPVFDFKTRIKGIKNIWSSETTRNIASQLLNSRSTTTISELSLIYSQAHLGNIHGVKSAILNLDSMTYKFWIKELLSLKSNNFKNLNILDLALEFCLARSNKDLAWKLLELENVKSSHQILRNIKYFVPDFQIKALLKSSSNSAIEKFAITMMKPYVNRSESIQKHLLENIKSAHHLSSTVFALSRLENIKSLQNLKSIYFTSNSKKVRTSVLKILKSNPSQEAKIIFSELHLLGDLQ